ncbi:hypothetical protein GQ53DRAFT_741283 [Thozetella sp. PMI_491]|nr:hypothetical protein GQ53DRAFT_741283 [Thozetella sp. PMI_491]
MLLRHEPAMEDHLFNSVGASSEVLAGHETQPQGDLLDDVWGAASDSESPDVEPRAHHPPEHPSDMPRLQQEHATAGYRDGITMAKAKSIQAGFDEGFGLGATVGARVGQLLGLLEGIATALDTAEEQAAQVARRQLAEARRELTTTAVFSAEYWNTDGTWKYEVRGSGEAEAGVVFADVASAHPLVRKWDALAKLEAERWHIDLGVLATDQEGGRSQPEEVQREIKAHAGRNEPLAW